MTIPETDPNQLLDYFLKILLYRASKVMFQGLYIDISRL